MEPAVLGWSPDGPKLHLDHERFAYAGKFVMTDTGKAVLRDGDEVVGAASFSPDRTDESVLRIRYITVAADRRGGGLGPRLAGYVVAQAFARDYQTVKIAVNNPYAYEAMYRAGFGFTGEETGVAELVLAVPGDRSSGRYADGLSRFARRDLDDEVAAFVARKREDGEPPATVP